MAHYAALAAQLPPHGRVARAMNPNAEWDMHAQLLGLIHYAIETFHYGFTEDAAKKINAPKCIVPGLFEDEEKQTTHPLTVCELKNILSLPRKEV